MYWRWNRIPELADLPLKEQKRLWKEAQRDPLRPKDVFWVAVFFAIFSVPAIVLISAPKDMQLWIGLPTALVVVFGFGAIADAIKIRRYRPVVQRLRDRG